MTSRKRSGSQQGKEHLRNAQVSSSARARRIPLTVGTGKQADFASAAMVRPFDKRRSASNSEVIWFGAIRDIATDSEQGLYEANGSYAIQGMVCDPMGVVGACQVFVGLIDRRHRAVALNWIGDRHVQCKSPLQILLRTRDGPTVAARRCEVGIQVPGRTSPPFRIACHPSHQRSVKGPQRTSA
jgi:hypothetical protein